MILQSTNLEIIGRETFADVGVFFRKEKQIKRQRKFINGFIWSFPLLLYLQSRKIRWEGESKFRVNSWGTNVFQLKQVFVNTTILMF